MLVIAREEDGDGVVWKNSLSNGLCMDDADVLEYDLKAIAANYPCHN